MVDGLLLTQRKRCAQLRLMVKLSPKAFQLEGQRANDGTGSTGQPSRVWTDARETEDHEIHERANPLFRPGDGLGSTEGECRDGRGSGTSVS